MPCRSITRIAERRNHSKRDGFFCVSGFLGVTITNAAVPGMQCSCSWTTAGFAQYVGHSCPTELPGHDSSNGRLSTDLLAVLNHDRFPQSRGNSFKGKAGFEPLIHRSASFAESVQFAAFRKH
jgi:hypothetical protein